MRTTGTFTMNVQPPVKITLFAADKVGLEIARFLGEKNALHALVMDAADPFSLNTRIALASNLPPASILLSNELGNAPLLLNNDLFLLAWWPYIIKKDLIELPKLGCLNFHPSLLPHNKGKHYGFWNIVEERPYGVTIHWVNEGIDTGDIAFQQRIATGWLDTGYGLKLRAEQTITRLFKKNFAQIIAGDIPRIQQQGLGSFHYGKEITDASEIKLHKVYTFKEFLNLIRAKESPFYRGAWFKNPEDGEVYEVRIALNLCPLNPPDSTPLISLEEKATGSSFLALIKSSPHGRFACRFTSRKLLYLAMLSVKRPQHLI